MAITYQIQSFSCYDNWTVESSGCNLSSILDKILRITTKITERFASDIVYLFPKIEQAVKEHEALDLLLLFREDGVSWAYADGDTTALSFSNIYRQVWRLNIPADADCNSNAVSSLKRVLLVYRGEYNTEIVGV